MAASAGNFGQGVAFAARAHGIPFVVFAAENANAGKVAAMRRLGAQVRLAGRTSTLPARLRPSTPPGRAGG